MENFRIAVAGCGSMSNAWIQNTLERNDVKIVSLVDLKTENAELIKEKYNLKCNIYTDLKTAISESGANLVFNITPPENHRDVIITALESGCSVFGEKPMAASMEQAREMVRVSVQTGKSYSVMQNRRYSKNIRAFKKIIEDGAIGKPGMICTDFFLGPHFGGFRDIMESPLILDMAIHTFDQARFITGQDAVSVYCHEFNPPGSWYCGNAAAICIFEMTGGSVFSYRGSWCSEGVSTSWQANWRIYGSKGTAIWDGDNTPYYETVIPSCKQEFTSQLVRVDPPLDRENRKEHAGCLDEMFTALKEGKKAETDCTDNIKSMAMVFASLQSAREGRKVFL